MPVDIKGHVLKDMVGEVRRQKGEPGEAALAQQYGPIVFRPDKIYSEEECIRLLKAVSVVLFGSAMKENLEKTGRLLAQVHMRSPFIKMASKLLAGGMFKGLFMTPEFLSTMDKGVRMLSPSLRTTLTNPDPFTLVATFHDTKMPPEIFKGEWDETFTFLCGKSVRTSLTVLTPMEFQIKIHSIDMKNMENTVHQL